MKVTWEESDIQAGIRVRKELECIIGTDPYDWGSPAVLVVLENGRLMNIGTRQEMAEYLTEHGYKPT